MSLEKWLHNIAPPIAVRFEWWALWGLLGAVLFDAVAPGPATMSVSGTGMGPGGTPMGLQFRPVTVQIQP